LLIFDYINSASKHYWKTVYKYSECIALNFGPELCIYWYPARYILLISTIILINIAQTSYH